MPRLARARAQRCGAALLLALLACAPTTRPAPLLDEAMRIGVPEVAEAPALDRRASVSIFVEQGSFVVEARGPGIKVERARVTDLAKEGHRITALHDALELLPLPDDAASVAAPQSVELWIPAATPFGDAVDGCTPPVTPACVSTKAS